MKNKIIIITVTIFLLVGSWFLWNSTELGKQGKSGKQGKQENVAIPAENPYRDAQNQGCGYPCGQPHLRL